MKNLFIDSRSILTTGVLTTITVGNLSSEKKHLKNYSNTLICISPINNVEDGYMPLSFLNVFLQSQI